MAHPLIRLLFLPPPPHDLLDSLKGFVQGKKAQATLSFLVCCVGAQLVPGAVISTHQIITCKDMCWNMYIGQADSYLSTVGNQDASSAA